MATVQLGATFRAAVGLGPSSWPCISPLRRRLSASERPPTLERFRQALLGVGHISGPRAPRGWSKLPQYRWHIGSFEGTQAVIALLWPWLGATKRTQAASALRAYLARNAQRRSSVRLYR